MLSTCGLPSGFPSYYPPAVSRLGFRCSEMFFSSRARLLEDHLPHVWAHQVFDAYAKPKRLVAGDPDYDEPADPWWISSWLHDEHVLMHHLVTETFATVERMLRTWKRYLLFPTAGVDPTATGLWLKLRPLV